MTHTHNATHTKGCKRAPAGSRALFDTTTWRVKGSISQQGLVAWDEGQAPDAGAPAPAKGMDKQRAARLAALLRSIAEFARSDPTDANHELTAAATELAGFAGEEPQAPEPKAAGSAADARRQ